MVERKHVDELITYPTIGECVTLSQVINKHAKNIAEKINDKTCEAICAEMEISIGVKIKPQKMRKWLALMKHFEEEPNSEEMADYAIVCRLKRAEEEKRQLEAVNAKLSAKIGELEEKIIDLENNKEDL